MTDADESPVVQMLRAGRAEDAESYVRAHPNCVLEVDESGHSIAHWAALCGDVNMLRAICSLGGPLDVRARMSGMQPLHWACTTRQLSAISFLTSDACGCDLNCRDVRGTTPLMLCAQKGHTYLVYWLLRRGADASLVDRDADTALHWACYNDHAEAAFLLATGEGGLGMGRGLAAAADTCGDGVEPTAQPPSPSTAAASAAPGAAATSAAPGAVDEQGGGAAAAPPSPPDAARADGGGLSLLAADAYGSTPLHLASGRGCAEAARVLLRRAEERGELEQLLRQRDAQGRAVEQVASEKGQLGLRRMLSEAAEGRRGAWSGVEWVSDLSCRLRLWSSAGIYATGEAISGLGADASPISSLWAVGAALAGGGNPLGVGARGEGAAEAQDVEMRPVSEWRTVPARPADSP